LIGLGDIFVREGNDEEALKSFEKLIRISDGSFVALTYASDIYRRQRQYEKAMAYYERVLEIDPQNTFAWHGKADCFRAKKDYPSAIMAWRMALKYGMNPKIAMTRIGDVYMSMKDLEQAAVNYGKALALGYDKYAYLGMAKIHTIRNQLDEAIKILSMLVEKEPNDSRIAAEFKELVEKYPHLKKTVPGLEAMHIPQSDMT
jgi:tetratricopeptide (TPR) repeat protein